MADVLFPRKDALAVAAYSIVGVSLRYIFSHYTANSDYGIDTTTNSFPSRHFCVQSSGASGFFLQNAVGCFLIAAVGRRKSQLHPSNAAGLSSGLCGSLTTFATWMHHTSITILQGEVWMALIGLLSMFCVSMCSFTFGYHAAACLKYESMPWEDGVTAAQCGQADSSSEESDDMEPHASANDWTLEVAPQSCSDVDVAPSLHPVLSHAEQIIVFSSVLVVAMSAVVMWFDGDHWALRSLCCAPFGALLRWALSRFNPKVTPIPWFTLLANVFGSCIGGVSAVLAVREDGELKLWLMATGHGFAGSLSTVSTFITELKSGKIGGFGLETLYAFLSFSISVLCLLSINGFVKCP